MINKKIISIILSLILVFMSVNYMPNRIAYAEGDSFEISPTPLPSEAITPSNTTDVAASSSTSTQTGIKVTPSPSSETTPTFETTVEELEESTSPERSPTVTEDGNVNLNSVITTSDGIIFDTNTGTITDYIGDSVSLEIPSEINDILVVEIGNNAFLSATFESVIIPGTITNLGHSSFKSCDNLQSVSIKEGLSSISDYMFYSCDNLTTISMASTITNVGYQSFMYCKSLESIDLSNVTEIGESAFSLCHSLNNVMLSNRLTNLSPSTFSSCGSLQSIVLPDSLTSIGLGAFVGCNSLVNITIPQNVSYMASYVFSQCNSLEYIDVDVDNLYYKSIDGVLFSQDEKTLLKYPDNKPGPTYTIPETVETIQSRAFMDCNNIQEIIMGGNVKFIRDSAFSKSSFSEIVLPNNVSYIGAFAFNYSELKSITIYNSDITIYDHRNVFGGCDDLIIYSIIGSSAEVYANENGIPFVGYTPTITAEGIIFIKETGTIIDYNGNTSNLYIPSSIEGVSVTKIGISAFSNASFLNVGIPNSVTTIDSSAFTGCSNITNIEIPSSIQSIGESAFSSCSSLYKIDISSSVNFIGINAFTQCSNITIYGVTGSYAQTYADANNIRFRATSAPPSSLQLNAKIPENNATLVNKTSSVELHFDENVSLNSTASNHIELFEYNTDIQVSINISVVNGYIVRIKPTSGSLKNGTKYYIKVDSNAIFSSKDLSTYFTGYPNKGDYVFTTTHTTASNSLTYVDLVYPKKGLLNWSDNTEVPPIPEGSQQDYIDEIYEWVKQYNLEGEITKAEISEVIDSPLDMPIKDENGSLYFTNDGTGTIQEFARDIIFVESLQPYLEGFEEDLASTKIHSLPWNKYKDERGIYDRMITYSDRISEYFGQKDDSIYLNFVAAGLLETIIVSAKNELGFDFISSYVKQELKNSALEDEINNVTNSNNYSEILSSLSNINTAYKAGTQLYRFTQEGVASGDFVFSMADLVAMGMETSGNKTLKLIGDSYQDVQSFMSAFSMCLTLGSSIGFYGYVVDFYFQSKKDISKSLKMWYLISDYYIYQNYPNLYQAVFKESDFLVKDSVKELATLSHGQGFSFFLETECSSQAYHEYVDNKNADPILKRWGDYIENVVTQRLEKEIYSTQGEEGICDLRLAIGGLSSTIRFCEDIDIPNYKLTLLKYISAKNKKNYITGILECPILINVYDNNDILIETISTYGDVPVGSITGSFYLGGDNNESKIFIVNSNQYWIEIIPYSEGTMDITLLDDNNVATVYSDVELTDDMIFTSTSLGDNMEITCNQSGGSELLQADKTVPVGSVNITYDSANIMIGETTYPVYKVLPENATNQNLTWSISDNSIAQVDSSGAVTGVGMGNVTVTAMSADYPSISEDYEFMVYEPLTQLSIDASEYNILDTETILLELNVLHEQEHIIPYINWNSEDAEIAFVNNDLELFGLSEGTTLITGEYFDMGIELTVTVTHDTLSDYDVNGDSTIDMLDIIHSAQNYAISYDINEYANACDLNNDSIINLFDLVMVSRKIG